MIRPEIARLENDVLERADCRFGSKAHGGVDHAGEGFED